MSSPAEILEELKKDEFTQIAVKNSFKMPMEKFLATLDPVDRLHRFHACVFNLKDMYDGFTDCFKKLIEPEVFKTYGTGMSPAFAKLDITDGGLYDKAEFSSVSLMDNVRKYSIFPELGQKEVTKIYFMVFSELTWENFLGLCVYFTEGKEWVKQPELLWTDDKPFAENPQKSLDKIPEKYLRDIGDLDELLKEVKFPFDREKAYLLKQQSKIANEFVVHYYLYLPHEAFIN